jgi:hypothetical protein
VGGGAALGGIMTLNLASRLCEAARVSQGNFLSFTDNILGLIFRRSLRAGNRGSPGDGPAHPSMCLLLGRFRSHGISEILFTATTTDVTITSTTTTATCAATVTVTTRLIQ